MRISLNLATRPFADLGPALKRLRIASGVLAALAIGLGLGVHALHQKAQAARTEEEAIQKKINSIQQERLGYQALMRQPANADLLVQAGALNQLFDEKAFSWTLAMEDLETVLPGGVQVTTLEPTRAKDGHITLRLRVVGPRDKAVELVSNLEHSKHFLLPRITGESSESTGSGINEHMEPISLSSRVNFDLLADYNPGAPGEVRAAQKPEKKAIETPLPVATQPTQPTPIRRPLPSAPRPVSPQVMQRPGFPSGLNGPQGMADAMRLRHHGIPQPNLLHAPNQAPNSMPNAMSGGPQ